MTEEIIQHPLTGELIDPTDIDALGDALIDINRCWDLLKVAKDSVVTAIAKHATEEGATRRVRGERHRIKLTMPKDHWSSSILGNVWGNANYEKWSRQYVRPSGFAPNIREIKKLENESGGPKFEEMKQLIFAARSEPRGLPSVKFEDDE